MSEKLRATLGFLEKVTLEPAQLNPRDVVPLREVGLDKESIQDALMVCTLFQIIDRIADALDFHVPEEQKRAGFMPSDI